MKMTCSNSQMFEFRLTAKPLLRPAPIMLVAAATILVSPQGLGQKGPQSESSSPKMAQEAPPKNKSKPTKNQPKNKSRRPARGAFAAAPIPISSPAIGSGIVPVMLRITIK